MKQIHVYFSGRVQGVGLRYGAKEIADRLALKGYVKNLPDGRVELLAEGGEENLKKLLDELSKLFAPRNSEISWSKTTGRFSSFEIIL
ncbi:MAG TPA: acylphosphatase [Patescibacteria group bacterium]|nr:acylphosphatase [Patescibacteria group bacterium]